MAALKGLTTVAEIESGMRTLMYAIAPDTGRFSESTVIRRSDVEQQIVQTSARLITTLNGAGVQYPFQNQNAEQWAEALVANYVMGWVYENYSRAGEQGDTTGEELKKSFEDALKHIQKDPTFWNAALGGTAQQGALTSVRHGAGYNEPKYKMGSDNHF